MQLGMDRIAHSESTCQRIFYLLGWPWLRDSSLAALLTRRSIEPGAVLLPGGRRFFL